MQIRQLPPLAALRRQVRLTIPEIGAESGPALQALTDEARQRRLAVSGPPVFRALGMPRDTTTRFDMEFCLPVEASADGALPALNCACLMHHGPLSTLFEAGYAPLLAAMEQAGLQPGRESREVYHQWQGPESPDNRIEIQIAIAE